MSEMGNRAVAARKKKHGPKYREEMSRIATLGWKKRWAKLKKAGIGKDGLSTGS